MSRRKIEKGKTFERELARLDRRYRGLANEVELRLDSLASGEILNEKRYLGFKGLIYQIRCGTGSMGRKNGARIIYYKDESRLLILYIYLKNAAGKISSKKIERILKECL